MHSHSGIILNHSCIANKEEVRGIISSLGDFYYHLEYIVAFPLHGHICGL